MNVLLRYQQEHVQRINVAFDDAEDQLHTDFNHKMSVLKKRRDVVTQQFLQELHDSISKTTQAMDDRLHQRPCAYQWFWSWFTNEIPPDSVSDAFLFVDHPVPPSEEVCHTY
jgi:hypothetical protein